MSSSQWVAPVAVSLATTATNRVANPPGSTTTFPLPGEPERLSLAKKVDAGNLIGVVPTDVSETNGCRPVSTRPEA